MNITGHHIIANNCENSFGYQHLMGSISRHSQTHWVIDELIKEKYTLCVTTEILNEYEEIISKKLGLDTAKSILELFDNLPNIED